ncbi:MAG: hypothetical protein AAGA56_12920 [Myxococcota bacterium]
MADPPGMLVWTLRRWPKAQYLALALGIPPAAWDIPFLFAALGGPEISVFEAYDKPELGGLTNRLKALTRPLSEAVHRDRWARENLFQTEQLAVAFHPGTDFDEVVKRGREDGYRVEAMDDLLDERTTPASSGAVGRHEGLEDWQSYRLARWRFSGLDDRAIYARTLAVEGWGEDFSSAGFFLLSRLEDLALLIELGDAQPPSHATRDWVVERLATLAFEQLAHPSLLTPFLQKGLADRIPGSVWNQMRRIDPNRIARVRG